MTLAAGVPVVGPVPGDATIEWRRLAEPQADRYDTSVAVGMAQRLGWARREPGGGPSFFDGRVAVVNDLAEGPLFPTHCVPASPSHPNIARAAELIRLWPAVFDQFQAIIESVNVFVYRPEGGDDPVPTASGATRLGAIAATVDHVVGFAESLVHELAHQKLWALGVEVESARRLIRNPPTQKFTSPIELDRLRPMPAVAHDVYSYSYVAALDVVIAGSAHAREAEQDAAAHALARHLPALELGLEVIRDHADLDGAGEAFMAGWQHWLARTLAEGRRILDARGIRASKLIHPLAGETVDGRVSRPARHEKVREYRLGDELLLYLPERQAAHALNASAAAIWRLCDGARTADEIGEELGRSLGRPGSQLLADVQRGLAELRGLGLLAGR